MAVKFDPNGVLVRSKQEQLVHKWLLNGKEVSVLRQQDALTFLVVDRLSKAQNRVPIPLGESEQEKERRLEDAPAYFRNCYVTLDDKNVPTLTLFNDVGDWPFPVQPSNLSKADLRLVWREEQLTWLLFDRTINAASWVDVDTDASPSLKEYLSKSGQLPDEHLPAYLMHFKPLVKCSDDGRILSAALINSSTSRFDCDLFLDENNWAVTLISAGSSSHYYDANSKLQSLNTDLKVGHAVVAYEGTEIGRAHV